MSYCNVTISYPYYISGPTLRFLNYIKYKNECYRLGNPIMWFEEWLNRDRND